MTDRAYANLLTHLHRSTTTLPIQTVQASISHYLARLSPRPTPLSATVVSSPLFHPFSNPKLQAVSTAFRHAAHIKYKALEEDQAGLFTRSIKTRFAQWVKAAVKGFRGSQPVMRLAAAGGLLLALEDLKHKAPLRDGGARGGVEDEVVVALAEVMDTYAQAQPAGAWEHEFQPVTERGEVDALSLGLILASQSLPLVSDEKLKAFPLHDLTRLLTSSIDSAFHSGNFLSSLSSSTTTDDAHKLTVLPTSSLAQDIQAVSSSPLMAYIGPLSKLCSKILSLLLDSNSAKGFLATAETLGVLETLTAKVEADWAASSLSSVTDENELTPQTREVATRIWTTLKTLLFSSIMLAETILSAIVYVPPQSLRGLTITPASLALTTLHTLSQLAFVITQFGGVTTTSGGGFPELKRTFYLALDILSASPSDSERFVRELYASLPRPDAKGKGKASSSGEQSNAMQQAKTAYVLASIEQLVPVLSEQCIEECALPICISHVFESTNRETFESAHSVVLAIFASHAQRAGELAIKFRAQKALPERYARPGLSERLVPFYADCLIANTADGKLNTAQLTLAFAALVRSSSASGTTAALLAASGDQHTYALAWYCIDALLGTLHAPGTDSARSHRLHLMLVAAVPAVPLELLPRVLREVRTAVVALPWDKDKEGPRAELVGALFKEILERVGDREKEYALKWWYENREILGGVGKEVGESASKELRPLVSRL